MDVRGRRSTEPPGYEWDRRLSYQDLDLDPSLRAEIGPVVAEFATLVRPDMMAPSILTDAEHRNFYLTARETMLGLALGRATRGAKPVGHERPVLARLRAEAAAIDSRTTGGAPHPTAHARGSTAS